MEIVTRFHPAQEFLKRKNISGTLYITREKNDRLKTLLDLAERRGITVVTVSKSELDDLAEGRELRGFLLMYHAGASREKTDLPRELQKVRDEDSCVLILDGITDPQNLGAILRSADLFHVDLVVLPTRRTAHVSEVVVTTSSGAAHHVQMVQVPNLTRAVEECKKEGFWVYGADTKGEPIDTLQFTGKTAVVLGSEGRGMSRIVKEHCDTLLRIPSKGHVDSFNVSVAAGIILFEIRRQQGFS